MQDALHVIMLASRLARRSVTLVGQLPSLPRVLDRLVGGMLELMIHSIEGLRDRLAGAPLPRTLASASGGGTNAPDTERA
jgi:hypothetical protein